MERERKKKGYERIHPCVEKKGLACYTTSQGRGGRTFGTCVARKRGGEGLKSSAASPRGRKEGKKRMFIAPLSRKKKGEGAWFTRRREG